MNLRQRFLTQYILLPAALLLAGVAQAADYNITPSIIVSEEYTDNIAEDRDRSMGGDFITRLVPGLSFKYAAPFWTWDVGYNYEFRFYARHKREHEDLHNLKAKTRWTLLDEKAFLDISDEYSRVSLDQSRDRVQDSLFTDQSDQNLFTVSPNFVLRPTSKLTLFPGASYQNIWYKDKRAVDREVYSGYLNSDYVITDKLSLISSYLFALTDAKGNLSRTHNIMAGIKYEFFRDSFVSIQGGNSWIMTSEHSSSNPVWEVAINYARDRYNFRAGTGRVYANEPTSNRQTLNTNYNLGFDYFFDRGSAGITSSIVKVENIPENTVFSVSYNNGVNMKYVVFRDWEANLAYSFNYIDIRHSDTYTKVSLLSTGITYSYSEDTKMRLYYKYLHMFSPVISVDNKDVNTIGIEISKTF